MEKELKNLILRNKLYSIIEFLFCTSQEMLEFLYIHNAEINHTLSKNAIEFLKSAMYTIYEGVGNRNDMPETFAHLFAIESIVIMLYTDEYVDVLNELYEFTKREDTGEYKFLNFINDNIVSYNKYKELYLPQITEIIKSRNKK